MCSPRTRVARPHQQHQAFSKPPYGPEVFHCTEHANYCWLRSMRFSFSSHKKVNVLKHTKAPVDSTAAESYIIFWVYGFLISRYSSQDDVTDMDPEHIWNIFLEDIQYGCQETFDQIIKIDNLINLELHQISKVLLGVITGGVTSIDDKMKMGMSHSCRSASPANTGDWNC